VAGLLGAPGAPLMRGVEGACMHDMAKSASASQAGWRADKVFPPSPATLTYTSR